MKQGQFPAVVQLSALDGQVGFKIIGEEDSYSSWSVSGIGDVNGDGYDDVLIGAYVAQNYAGRSYVVFGGSEVGQAGFVNLSSLNGTNGFKLDGEVDGDESGISVSGAGDINKDGYSDFLIGAAAYSSTVIGKAYLIFGGATIGQGLNQGILPLSDLNGVNGFKLMGDMAGVIADKTGMSVSSAGDINQDGYDDLLIGALYMNSSTTTETGGAYAVYGGSAIGSTGLIELSSLNGTNGFKLEGEQHGDWCGYSVSRAGDINQDDYPDMIIGATYASPTGKSGAGSSYLVFGGGQVGRNGFISLAGLNGTNGFKLDGETPDDYSGSRVSALGDINGDNIDDFVISAPTTIIVSGSPPVGGPGNNYVIFGGKGVGNGGLLPLASLNGTQGFKIIGEDATGNSGVGIKGVDDINGDGYSDLLIGAWKASPDNRSKAGSSYLVFGGPQVGKTGLISLADLDGTNGFKLAGEIAGDLSGTAVSGAGDSNGDGIPDLLIGAPDASGKFGVSYVVFGDIPPVLTNNNLTIQTGDSVLFNASMLLATDKNHGADELLFSIVNLEHGQFFFTDNISQPITRFYQQDVFDSRVIFQHDKSGNAPEYAVMVNTTGLAFIPAQPAQINFEVAPVILNNVLRIDQGQTVILNSGLLSATTQATAIELGALLFNLMDVQHGYFNWVNAPTVPIFDFYQQNITSRLVQFTHDNSTFPPAYRVSVTDGRLQTDAMSARIIFNSPKISGQFPAVIELSSLNGQWGFKIEGGTLPQWAGDINRDGYADLLLPSPNASPNGKTGAGISYVLFGAPSLGRNGIIYLADINGANGFQINGEVAGDGSGNDAQEIGIFPDKNWDFNRDGYADIVIGAPGALSSAGRSYVVFGYSGIGSNGTIELSDLNGANGFRLDGEESGDVSGASVSGVEDINEDGYDDLIIGAPQALSNAGRSYVVFGGQTVGKNGFLNLTDLNGANGFKLNGANGDRSGAHVRPMGDINGDGINDLLIGAIEDSPDGRAGAGCSYILFGHAGIGSSGEMDLFKLDGTDGFKINGEMPYDYSGRISSGLGDFDGDGHPDFSIGAYGHNNFIGRSYIIYGQEDIGGDGILELSDLDGTNGFKLDGEFTGDSSGYDLRWAGDINGDTYPDLLIGLNGRLANLNNYTSRSYIVFGGPWAGNVSLLALGDLEGVHGFKLTSTISQDILWVGGVGDVNVDGMHDFVVGSLITGVNYVIFGDMAPVFMNNQLSINQGERVQINDSSLLAVSINHNASQILLSIKGLQHGQFQWDADPQSNITQFYQQDVLDGHVYFQHDNSLYAPIYSVAANTTGMAWMPAQAASIDFYAQPVLLNNSITIGQGQTVTLTSAELLAMHNGMVDPDLLFLISNVTHVNFFISALPISPSNVSFTQQAILEGEVSIQQDDSTELPNYQVVVTDGSSQTEPESVTVTFYKKPVFTRNQLFLKKGGALLLTMDNLCANNCSDPASNDMQFVLQNMPQFGQFELGSNPGHPVGNFSQQDVNTGAVQFVTDGSSQSPRYNLTLIDPLTGLNNTAAGSTLLLLNNYWPINQGENFTLTSDTIDVTGSLGMDSEIMYAPLTDVGDMHGYFALSTAPKVMISNFTQGQIFNGQVLFMPDGSSTTPSMTLSVSDGQPQGAQGNVMCYINFAIPPLLDHAFLKINQPDAVQLTLTNLQAIDKIGTPNDQLIFIINQVKNTRFSYRNDFYTPISNFSQQAIIDQQVLFIDEIDQVPSFLISVWNGRMMCVDNCPRWGDVVAPASGGGGGSQNKLLEGLFSMALSIILVPILRYGVEKTIKKYLSWRNDDSIDSEIASAVLSQLWIGTCCLITRTHYEKYARAVNYIVDELEKTGDEAEDKSILLRTKWQSELRYQEKESVKSIIARSVKEGLDQDSHWCCRFFRGFCRPEITPEELKAQAPDIARRARPRLSDFFNPQHSRVPSDLNSNQLYHNMSSLTGVTKTEEKKPLLG